MKARISLGIGVLVAAFGVSALGTAQASMLSKIGHAVTYPVKKAAGNGSKIVNHSGKAVVYPVRKAGVNTSKSVHKITKKK